MTWVIAGESGDVSICVTEHGNAVIRGKSSHTPYIFEDSWEPEYPAIKETMNRLQTVQADWRMFPVDATQNEIIDNVALLKEIEAKPEKSIVEISCIDSLNDSKPALLFNIALQPQMFRQVYDLLSMMIMVSCKIEYSISVGFLTFRSPDGGGEWPTLDQFKSGRPYFTDKVFVSVRRADKST